MAYIGADPANKGTGLFSQDTFTGDGSTTTFDLSNVAPDGGGNDIQVFVDNVRQQQGSSNAYTLGEDGSGDLKRITFTTAPASGQSIFVLNPGTKNVQQLSTISDNTVTTAKVQDLAVSTAKIAADAITGAKLADDSVDSEHFVDGSIDTAHLGNLQVTTAKIAADAIDATKLADDAVSEEHLDATAISGHTELTDVAADNDVLLIFDTTAGALRKIQRSKVRANAPTITSISPTAVASGDGTGNYTFTITGTNYFAGTKKKKKTNGGTNISFDTVTIDSTTQLTCVVAKNTANLTHANEPFDVVVTNNDGTSTLENQVTVDGSPIFSTSAGSLGTFSEQTSVGNLDIIAHDPDSGGNVSFEFQSGSLPPGLSSTTIHENGVSKFRISGTLSTDRSSSTTTNFTIRAFDAASNTTSRAFSITETPSGRESFTSSGTFSVPTGINNLDVLVIAGGGSGGGFSPGRGGGGAGGVIFAPDFPVTPGGTVTVTVGCGGTSSGSGQDSVFGTLTAKGGGGRGQSGGSGGGGDPGVGPGAATQPTQPGFSGAYGFGNAGAANSPGPNAGGGGGGAGSAGSQGGQCNAGSGGSGKSYTIADGTTPVAYAGGGGGGMCASSIFAGGSGGNSGDPTSPSAGGGRGGQGNNGGPNKSGGPRQANRGGGGGGAAQPAGSVGNGGKGIVIVHY